MTFPPSFLIDNFHFRNDTPAGEIGARFEYNKIVKYFAYCFGTVFILEICRVILKNISSNSEILFYYMIAVVVMTVKFASIIIIIAILIIAVKKLCDNTLREDDDSRPPREYQLDK
jgi:hypothetical protein